MIRTVDDVAKSRPKDQARLNRSALRLDCWGLSTAESLLHLIFIEFSPVHTVYSQEEFFFPENNRIEIRPHSFCRWFREPTLSRLRGIHDLEEVLVQEQLRALEAWTIQKPCNPCTRWARKITIHLSISTICIYETICIDYRLYIQLLVFIMCFHLCVS